VLRHEAPCCIPGSAGRNLEECSWILDLMPNPESKDKRDSSLAENQRPCPGVWDGALGDPRDMVKAGSPDSLAGLRPSPTSRCCGGRAGSRFRCWDGS